MDNHEDQHAAGSAAYQCIGVVLQYVHAKIELGIVVSGGAEVESVNDKTRLSLYFRKSCLLLLSLSAAATA